MEPINYQITAKELRKFGLVTGALFAIIFGLFLPWVFNADQFPVWPWGIFFVLSTWAIIHPGSLKLVYIPWMKMANVLGWINSRIILGIMFYLIIFPVGLLMRLFGKDPMNRLISEEAISYRTPSKPRDKSHMERPY